MIIACYCNSTLCNANSLAISSLPMTSSLTQKKNIIIGAWAPSNFRLEKMQEPRQVNEAILTLLGQGFNEYYFVMRDFNNKSEAKATEQLLKIADKTDLKIIIILLPPSESGNYGAYSSANYDWKGWIVYFNSLKRMHTSSFLGFAVDDFNPTLEMRRLNITNNMHFMASSNLSAALYNKRTDVHFYPVMYLDTAGFETLKKYYDKFISGIILVSPSWIYSPRPLTLLNDSMKAVSQMFENKPLKYIIYPKAQNAMLPENLLANTLSTASRLFSEIIIYVRTDNSIIQDFLRNLHDHHHDFRSGIDKGLLQPPGNQITTPPPTPPPILPILTCSLPPLNGSIPCNNENKSI